MFCPSCGAQNDDKQQRYCRECGTSLPALDATRRAIAHRPADATTPIANSRTSGSSLLAPRGARDKLVLGSVALVAMVALLYVVLKVIVATIVTLIIPLAVVLAAGILGYVYLRSLRKR